MTIIIFSPAFSYAVDTINLHGPSLLATARIFIKPSTGNFAVGSSFEAPIYIDTKNNSINAINVKLRFDPSKLSVIKSSSGNSIFGIWIENPNFDNIKGTASLVGVIPNGIITSAGLITTVTFKVLSTGFTTIKLTDYSSANLNDGYGTEVRLSESGASYTLTPQIANSVEETSANAPRGPIVIYIHDSRESLFIPIYVGLFKKYSFYLLFLLLLLLEERKKEEKPKEQEPLPLSF